LCYYLLSHSHNLCNISSSQFFLPRFRRFLPSAMVQNILFNFSCVSTSLAHSRSLRNVSISASYIAMRQAVFSYPSSAKNMLYNSSVLVPLYLTPTVCVENLFGPSVMLCARRFFHIHFWLRICSFTPLVSVCLYPTPIVGVIPLFGYPLMPCARQSSEKQLWLKICFLTPLVLVAF